MKFKIIFILFFLCSFLFYYFYFLWYSFSYFPPAKNVAIFPPLQPAEGPGGKDYLSEKIAILELKREEGTIFLFLPKNISLESLPIILVLPNSLFPSATSFSQTPGLIHLAKKGNILVVPVSQQKLSDLFDYHRLIDKVYNLSKEGLFKVQELAPNNDFSKFAIIGISLGGSIATHLVQTDLPQPKVFILIAPTEGLPLFSSQFYGIPFRDLKTLPYHSFLLGILAENDRIASPSQIKKLFKTSFSKEKHLFKIPSDTYGNPPLISNHRTLFHQYNALNFYGSFKLIEATLECAFYFRFCHIAKGETQETFFMGKWSNDYPVKQIISIPLK